MAQEIERKFLIEESEVWRSVEGLYYRQGYLCNSVERTVRVRTAGDKAFLTIKGDTKGATRLEFEYEIPFEQAGELLEKLCQGPLIEKKRRQVEYEGTCWEVDEFFGDNEGLIVAEVELESEDQQFASPPWLSREVTGDPRYYNANLVKWPYRQWPEDSS